MKHLFKFIVISAFSCGIIFILSTSGLADTEIPRAELPVLTTSAGQSPDVTTVNLAQEFEIDPTTCALNGGEDYELLFTINQTDFEKVKDLEDISIIGHMTDKDAGKYMISRSGTAIELKAQGWDAMKAEEE